MAQKLLVALLAAVPIAAQTCTTYTSNPGTATVQVTSSTYSFSCQAMSNYNGGTGISTYSGSASCPTMFNNSSLTWSYSTTATAGIQTWSGAGCLWGIGPSGYSAGTQNCSTAGDVCQNLYVTGYGQWIGIPGTSLGYFSAGPYYQFGYTACWPAAAASQQVCCGAH
jgi:hypothetical protein